MIIFSTNHNFASSKNSYCSSCCMLFFLHLWCCPLEELQCSIILFWKHHLSPFYFLLSAYFRLYKCICCCFYKVLKFLVFVPWGRTDNLADSKFRFYLVWKNGIGKGSKCFFSSDSKATDLIVEWTKQSAFDAIGFTYLLTSA